MRTLAALAIALAAAAGCKSGKHAATAVETPVDRGAVQPEWVRSRPVSSAYYIGIGYAPKGRADAPETARKNALNDLASEISVTVEGNSLLFTADGKNRFDEAFTSTIRTTTKEQIEGYELMDSWDGPQETWVYYRLSKAEHARIKAERKAKALANAKDLHLRARTAIDGGDLRSAVDLDLRALLAAKEYWASNDLVEIDGRQVPLMNEVYGHLQRMMNGVRITVLPERCELSYANRFKRELLVSVAGSTGARSQELQQLPLAVGYAGATGRVAELRSTDAEGRMRTTIQRVDPEQASKGIAIAVDMDGLVSKELEPALVKPLLASLNAPQVNVPIDLRLPRLHLTANETNLGQPVGDAGLGVVVREELTRRGFRFVEKPAEADLLLALTVSTRSGGEANGFFTAYLDATFTFRDRRTQEVVHEGARQAVKGIQLTSEKAGLDAYKKAAQDVRKELVPAMMNALQ